MTGALMNFGYYSIRREVERNPVDLKSKDILRESCNISPSSIQPSSNRFPSLTLCQTHKDILYNSFFNFSLFYSLKEYRPSVSSDYSHYKTASLTVAVSEATKVDNIPLIPMQ